MLCLSLVSLSIFFHQIRHSYKNRSHFQIFIINILLGVYGDVHRVKILFNKKDSALIQFATPQQAAVGTYRKSIKLTINL